MMELVVGADSQHMFERTPESLRIDPARARFPFCIVWTPLPVISWFAPFIGHIGICREDGVILDFAGPNFVCVDNFTFGAPTRYIQISEDHCISCIGPEKEMSWDDAVRKSTQEFQHRSYNLFTCNCHCFVAHTLNRLLYNGHNRWNVVNLAARIFLKGRWVSKTAIAQSYLPFFIVICIGLKLGGWTFLMGLAVFFVVFVGWFLFGSYFFSDLIQL